MAITTAPPDVDPDVERAARQDERRRRWVPRSLLLPALIFSIILTQIPFVVTIAYSSLEWNLL